MTESKAYFLGMLVGGGIINDSSFNVVLPFVNGEPLQLTLMTLPLTL